MTVSTGNVGQPWRANITEFGAVLPWDGVPLSWYVAADDRWHVPAEEPTVRQTRLEGTPVTETRVRVPHGDVVQRVYSTANKGGLTVVEVENESTMPIAVAFDRRGVLTDRPIPGVPVEGIELPPEAFVLPVGHATAVRVAIPHGPAGEGRLPAVPPVEQVVRGWLTLTEQAGRYVLPDGDIGAGLAEAVTAERCELALGAIPSDDDPCAFAVGLDQLVRMGEPPGPWIEDLADVVERVGPMSGWEADAALRAAHRVLIAADERRAADDVTRILDHRVTAGLPSQCPGGVVKTAWNDERFASGPELLPLGIPVDWYGQSFEVYGVPTLGGSTVSFGIRWHGERPAVLWEQTGAPVELTAPAVDPAWRTNDAHGEALWAAPRDGASSLPTS